MAQPIDPNPQSASSGPLSGASAKEFYQQAVTAFKAQDYDQAQALFQHLGQLPPDSPYYVKALMGQVRIHQRLGQVDRARLLCKQLVASPTPQASQWAAQVLRQLPEQPKMQPPTSMAQNAEADLSGFVPLAGATSSAQGPSVPAPRLAPPPPPNPLPATEKLPGSRPASGAEGEPEAAYRSLFHYQQLNQRPPEDQNDRPKAAREPLPAAIDQTASSNHNNSEGVPRPTTSPRSRALVPLPKRPLALWVGQALTAIAVLWAINWAVHLALRTLDGLVRWVRWPVQLSLPGASQSYTVAIVIGLLLLALASPWMVDYILALCHRQQPLSTRQLQAQSPDTLRLLRQLCRQRGWQLPALRIIPDPAPLCFSYGWLPRNSRIVVSQGLLDQCSDEALTALYGYELAGLVNGSPAVLSAVGLLLLLLHTSYYRLAALADALPQPGVKGLLGLVASAIYGLFWLLRQLVLWLSRLCCGWGDRRAVALTQHPDQLAEGLLQLTQAIAAYLQQWGSLHPLHTSLEVLMPVSSRQAITPGSLLGTAGGIAEGDRTVIPTMLMALDGLNPYRQWLRVSATHLPLGERLIDLAQQALLRGQPTPLQPPQGDYPGQLSPSRLLLQKGPLAGLLVGGGLAMGLWFLGGLVNRLGWLRLSWLYQDPSVLAGGLWLGLGLGLLLRINSLFPDADSPPASSADTADTNVAPNTIAALLGSTPSLPVQGQPVTLRGKLSGLAGTGNWGCQDLYLNDASGLVKLVNPVPLGSLQGLLQPHRQPLNWIGRVVTVTGWGRYGGGLLWVDINQVQLDPRHRFQAYGPIWATGISLVISLVGIATLFRGG